MRGREPSVRTITLWWCVGLDYASRTALHTTLSELINVIQR